MLLQENRFIVKVLLFFTLNFTFFFLIPILFILSFLVLGAVCDANHHIIAFLLMEVCSHHFYHENDAITQKFP